MPRNKNKAEHAVKAFVSLRKVINGTTSEKGIRDYLILLSICETCKYRNVDFLDFLRCGELDMEAFASRRSRTTRKVVNNAESQWHDRRYRRPDRLVRLS